MFVEEIITKTNNIMNYSENYSKVYPSFIITKNEIKEYALQNNNIDDIFYTLKKYIEIAFEKCSRNKEYCDNWLLWFSGKKSTVFLRDLFKEVGCDYWENLYNSNSIDRLDSLQHKIILKIKN